MKFYFSSRGRSKKKNKKPGAILRHGCEFRVDTHSLLNYIFIGLHQDLCLDMFPHVNTHNGACTHTENHNIPLEYGDNNRNNFTEEREKV